ncbi:MAG: hypothetical protein JWN40_3778 [Phycisphaerales bacterium]|nr:hypothetical protein [Phycisphaerales bacterium]
MVALKGHFDGKVIVPDEPLDLPRNQRLLVHIEPEVPVGDPPSPSALDRIAEQAVDDPSVPTDLAHQHDHYLYGKPKQP